MLARPHHNAQQGHYSEAQTALPPHSTFSAHSIYSAAQRRGRPALTSGKVQSEKQTAGYEIELEKFERAEFQIEGERVKQSRVGALKCSFL
jgi:hypothetical protein